MNELKRMVVKKNQRIGNMPLVQLTSSEDSIQFIEEELDLSNCTRGSLSILSLDTRGRVIGVQRVSVSDLITQRKEVLAGILLSNSGSIIVADNYEHIETSKQFLNMFLEVTSALDFKMLDYINIKSGTSLAPEITNKIVYTEKYNTKYTPIDLNSKFIKSNLYLEEDGNLELEELSKESAINALVNELRRYDTEYMCVLSLDEDDIPLNYNIISKGNIDRALVDAKTAIKAPILSSASKAIVLHNHPSYGFPIPSKNDDEVTFKLNNAFNMCNIKLEDHIIAGNIGKYSYNFTGRLDTIRERRCSLEASDFSKIRDVNQIAVGDRIATELSSNTLVLDIKESKFGDSKNAILFDGRQYVAARNIKFNMNVEKYEWGQGYYFSTLAKATAMQHDDDKSIEDVMNIHTDMNFKGFFKALVKSEMDVKNDETLENAFDEFMDNDEISLLDESVKEIVRNEIIKEYDCDKTVNEFDYEETKEKDDDIGFDFD